MSCTKDQPCGPEVHNLHCSMPHCAWGMGGGRQQVVQVINKPKAKPGLPLSAEVAKKFKEQNEKTKREALVLSIIDQLNERLEREQEIRGLYIGSDDQLVFEEVVKKFRDAGWRVSHGLNTLGQKLIHIVLE